MQKLLFIVVVLLVVGGAAFYLTSNTTEAPDEVENEESVPESGEATMRIGTEETESALGLSITLNDIVADNRCPVDVQCIEAGAITANVTFERGGNTETFNMPSDEVSKEWYGYRVSIELVEPPAYAQKIIPKEDYAVTFKVMAGGGE